MFVRFLPNGNLAALPESYHTSVRVWDTETGIVKPGIEQSPRPGPDGFQQVKWSLDGTLAAIALGKDLIELWDMGKNEIKQIFLQPEKTLIGAITLSSNGKFMTLVFESGCIRLWNTETGIEEPIFKGDPRRVTRVAFLPDDRVLALANEKEIYSWNREEEATKRVCGVDYPVGKVVIASLDGKLAEFGGFFKRTHNIRLFNMGKEEETRVLQGHSDSVQSVAFSPNSQLLASASADGTVRLWHAEKGKELCRVQAHLGQIEHVAFSPNGDLVATASSDGLGLWNVSQWMN